MTAEQSTFRSKWCCSSVGWSHSSPNALNRFQGFAILCVVALKCPSPVRSWVVNELRTDGWLMGWGRAFGSGSGRALRCRLARAQLCRGWKPGQILQILWGLQEPLHLVLLKSSRCALTCSWVLLTLTCSGVRKKLLILFLSVLICADNGVLPRFRSLCEEVRKESSGNHLSLQPCWPLPALELHPFPRERRAEAWNGVCSTVLNLGNKWIYWVFW